MSKVFSLPSIKLSMSKILSFVTSYVWYIILDRKLAAYPFAGIEISSSTDKKFFIGLFSYKNKPFPFPLSIFFRLVVLNCQLFLLSRDNGDVAKMCPLSGKDRGKGGQVGIEGERALGLGVVDPIAETVEGRGFAGFSG